MAAGSKLKNLVITQWLEAFPTLRPFTQAKLYKVVGPFLQGINIEALSGARYRPHFALYPLYEKTIEESLKYPPLYFEFFNEKNLQLGIPYDDTTQQHKKAISIVENALSKIFEDIVTFQDLAKVIDDRYTNDFRYKLQPDGQASLLELKLHGALYINDTELIDSIFHQIDQESKIWNLAHFGGLHDNIETWRKKLHGIVANRSIMMQHLEENGKDPRIQKLVFSQLVK